MWTLWGQGLRYINAKLSTQVYLVVNLINNCCSDVWMQDTQLQQVWSNYFTQHWILLEKKNSLILSRGKVQITPGLSLTIRHPLWASALTWLLNYSFPHTRGESNYKCLLLITNLLPSASGLTSVRTLSITGFAQRAALGPRAAVSFLHQVIKHQCTMQLLRAKSTIYHCQ
jgi:hypothetical protein